MDVLNVDKKEAEFMLPQNAILYINCKFCSASVVFQKFDTENVNSNDNSKATRPFSLQNLVMCCNCKVQIFSHLFKALQRDHVIIHCRPPSKTTTTTTTTT